MPELAYEDDHVGQYVPGASMPKAVADKLRKVHPRPHNELLSINERLFINERLTINELLFINELLSPSASSFYHIIH